MEGREANSETFRKEVCPLSVSPNRILGVFFVAQGQRAVAADEPLG
jgi:hypothetical protein